MNSVTSKSALQARSLFAAELPAAPPDLLQRCDIGRIAVATTVAEDDHRGLAGHHRQVALAEDAEGTPVVAVGIAVDQLAFEHRGDRLADVELLEILTGIGKIADKDIAAHPLEQGLQTVDQVQHEACGIAHRQADVADDDDARLIAAQAGHHRAEGDAVVGHAGAQRAGDVDAAAMADHPSVAAGYGE